MKNTKKNTEQQDLFDIFVAQGLKLASGMKISPNPELIADAMIGIIDRVEQDGAKNGINFPLEIIFKGGQEILTGMLLIHDIEPDEAMIQQAVGIVVGKYLEKAMKTGKMTKDQVAELAQTKVPEKQGQKNG